MDAAFGLGIEGNSGEPGWEREQLSQDFGPNTARPPGGPGPARAYRGQGQKVQKVMVQPINLIFRYLQNRSRIQVWLYEQVNMRIEGCIIGFDEYMNLVLDDAEEIHSKTKSRKQLGRIMLKGDNITLLQSVSS
ncbi:PREDICTED: small nuclear ribonucleoprotein E [Corvus brachyrhynchos]|uniref:small nuclear ribonucleoprotein E n=1 Tax=Corvus brachyrhynchos TaxID=85066 RepID=UPI0004DDF4C4|nr:PREDICTED: small nuclear ribonucleoprotein E [Corvus brachyrhynchos]